jgi:diguanylate cyclase (GGDEF)-like protein
MKDTISLAVMVIIIALVVLGAMLIRYLLKNRQDLLKMGFQAEQETIFETGDILTPKSHSQFLSMIAVVYLVVCLIIAGEMIIYPTYRLSDVLFTGIFGILGIIVFSLTRSSFSRQVQDWILTGIMGISIALIFFWFQGDPLSNILWVTPFLFLMMTIVFNREMIFLILALVTIFAGAVVLFPTQSQAITVDTQDYVVRLIIYAITVILAAFINKVYIARLRENDEQVGFQKMISDITTHFVRVTEENFDSITDELLLKSGEFLHADRAFFALFSEDLGHFRVRHEWRSEASGLDLESNVEVSLESLPFCTEKLLNGEIVYLAGPNQLPAEAWAEKSILIRRQIHSLVRIPIKSEDKILGFLGFDQINNEKSWGIKDFQWLQVLANILADALKKIAIEKEVNGLAYFDSLTNLPNRNLLGDRMEQAIELARRTGMHLGILFIDLDGFKEVNDTMGHDWGDQLLYEMGNRLKNSLRKYDTVARFGGDEFLIMIPQLASKEDLEQIVPKVMGAFNAPVIMGDQSVNIQGSCGIAIYPDDGEDSNSLIKNADLAMYAAKKNGKGQVAFCSAEMKDNVQQKISLTNSLYRALERNELSLHYQPQVNAVTQEIIGFEALIRWNHPTRGAISPAVFIPIAEETGLINSIGEWVLMTACAQNKAWQDCGIKPVQMSVNLSVEQFRCANLVPIVKKCLAETGLAPEYLELEITESIAMKETGYVASCLQELKAIGVGISIDDFGTEFSSLNRIKDLPVDRLKIDMQFVRGIAVDPKDESIIAVMIHLAKRLGLRVIAEGVETTTQLHFLMDEACDEIQGYYYFKPLSREEIEKDDFALLKSVILPE